mmetsp:Transcript_28026/g.59171  ORF Transcript_28026/g.59171 Transcript_28026/m.59171 type:complete len:105 (+) Transcript_28026:29-343(+)
MRHKLGAETKAVDVAWKRRHRNWNRCLPECAILPVIPLDKIYGTLFVATFGSKKMVASTFFGVLLEEYVDVDARSGTSRSMSRNNWRAAIFRKASIHQVDSFFR